MDPTVRLIEDLADRALGRVDRSPALVSSMNDVDIRRHLAALDDNARVDELPQPAGRGRMLKRLILRLGGFFLVRQRAANLAATGAINELVRSAEQMGARIEQERRRTAAAVASVEPRLVTAAQQHRIHFDQLAAQLASLEQTRADQAAQLQQLTARLDDLRADAVLERTRRRALERRVAMFGGHVASDQDERSNDDEIDDVDEAPATFDLAELYERFEASFRPSDDALRDRFATYIADLMPLAGGARPVLDIGTGRGELLEVLSAAGIPCRGVDLNPEAVAIARSNGLDVQLADVSDYLAATPDESLGAVIALHVVEHLGPAVLLALVDEMIRVLAPGGIVILETPNPTNLVVGASAFYHDPTHQRPVTPAYLAFLLHDRGFVDVNTRFLHPLPEFELEIPRLADHGLRSLEMLLTDLRWALKGPQDYAVIARRPSSR